LIPLFLELLGYSNENRDYVYLSDGGHFDNLGVYELVRRKCKVIFAVDAGADDVRAFGDLADTLRKCRIDFGVEIVFPQLADIRGDEHARAKDGFTEGLIRYDLNDSAQDGRLILIKPTMSKNLCEPVDVLNYAAENPPFPQQTTADQFFDESQFESYRRLGAFIGRECLSTHANLLPTLRVLDVASPSTTSQSMNESPTVSTKLLGMVLRRRRTTLPGRDGSLVDLFVLLLASTVAGLVVFGLFDSLVLGRSSHGCLTGPACQTEIAASLAGHSAEPLWKDKWVWRAMMDNIFIVVYSAMFITGFLVAVNAWFPRGDKRVRWTMIVCVLAVLTAVVDYAENFILVSALANADPTVTSAANLACVMAVKFALALGCAVLLAVSAKNIWRTLRLRWG
jgi:hypothetical protein